LSVMLMGLFMKKELFEGIAQKHLGIETLAIRKMDSLDFHEVSVWSLKDALEAAYRAGMDAGLSYYAVNQEEKAHA
jgi:hypothetical protein